MRRSSTLIALLVVALTLLPACKPAATPTTTVLAVPTVSYPPITPPPAITIGTGDHLLRLATTKQLAGTGLLAALLPAFADANNARVDVLAVTAAQAMALGASGQADAVLVDDHNQEAQFLAAGAGLNELDVLDSDVVILGPRADPAAIHGLGSGADALSLIALRGAAFISSGNDAEPGLWAAAGVTQTTGTGWYQSAGADAATALDQANTRSAYALADRAAWLEQKPSLPNLDLLVGGATLADDADPALRRTYGIIPVNPAQSPKVNFTLATSFAAWVTLVDTQQEIADFGQQTFGQAIFAPASAQWKTGQP